MSLRNRGWPTHVLHLACAAVICSLLIAAEADAQSRPMWIAFDSTPPGSPAVIVFDENQSNATDSFFDVFIHGFWSIDKVDPATGQHYQKIEVPGMGTISETGAPDLPALTLEMAITTGATSATLVETTWLAGWNTWDYLVWPQPLDELDREEGTPERFVKNDSLYQLNVPWPVEHGTNPTTRMTLGSIPAAAATVYPVKWNPSSGVIQVGTHARYHYSHGVFQKGAADFPLFTRERIRQAEIKFDNWPAVDDIVLPNPVFYDGEYLFITPSEYLDELDPLIKQKKARGFHTTVVTSGVTRSTCASIRTAIINWYNSTPAWRDHYCLLVGDVDVIPLCTAPIESEDYPSGFPTEDLYGSVNGNDLDEEVYVGRLSVDTGADVTEQVERILNYEDTPELYCCYDKVTLVAHKEGAPRKYVGAHESVRNATYAVPPVFTTRYGNGIAPDGFVTHDINEGLGLVAYRGHGSATAWTDWNAHGDDYDEEDIDNLDNGPLTPAVWSFACQNHSLETEDCFGEYIMNRGEDGAVSVYASTVDSYTDQNHELDRRMFRAVYHLGLTTQSHAIEYAEAKIIEMGWKSNPWMYLLLGDPDMQIRRRNPGVWLVNAPDTIETCPSPPCFLDVLVMDEQGGPVEDVLVAAWKPGSVGPTKFNGPDEVFDNRYTLGDGSASVPAEPMTPGWLYYTIQDDAGNSLLDSVWVAGEAVTAANDGAAGAGVRELDGRRAAILDASPNPFNPAVTIRFALAARGPATLDVYNSAGQRVRRLAEGDLPAGINHVRWSGTDTNGARVAAGIYFVRLSVGGVEDIRKVALVK